MFYWDRVIVFGPDTGDGGGQAEDSQQAKADDAQQDTGDATGNENGGEQARTFTQEELDRIIQERLERERRKLEAQKQAEREEAERKALEEQQKYRELADRLKSELEQVKPAAETAREQVERLTALIAEQINREIADWPEEVKALAPTEASAEEMLAWLEKSRPLAQMLMQPEPVPGNGRSPKPAGRSAVTEQELRNAARQRIRRTF